MKISSLRKSVFQKMQRSLVTRLPYHFLFLFACNFFITPDAYSQSEKLPFDLHRFQHIQTEGPWIEYDLATGDTLKIGPVELSQKNFYVQSRGTELTIRWPKAIAEVGTIEMISRGGQNLWYRDFKQNDVSSDSKSTEAFLTLDINRSYIPVKKLKDHFRFCILRRESLQQIGLQRICTTWLGAGMNAGVLAVGYVSSGVSNPRVYLQGKLSDLQGKVPVASGDFVRFLAELSTGESFEFASPAPKVDFDDVVQNPKNQNIRIIGHGPRPLTINGYVKENEVDYEWEKRLAFEATIRDSHRQWFSIFPSNQSDFYYLGEGGGIFLFKIRFDSVPQMTDQLEIIRPFRGLYSSSMVYEIKKKPSQKVSSDEGEIKNLSDERFEWTYKSNEYDEPQRSYFNVEENGHKYAVYHEMVRFRSSEISSRLSLVYSGRDLFFLGEVAFSHWFDSLLWMKNYWLSRERWGFSARYFQSFSEISTGTDGTTKLELKVGSADLRYRLKPGVWGRDETLGLIGAYQDVTIGSIQGGMLGAGAFWARSMPKGIDEIFNVFPIFRYPKWVDMEFIWYSIPMKTDIKLGTNYALNFHGKVMWTPKWFGEAGFGVKSYSITDQTLLQRTGLTTFYGTIGLGMTF